MAYAYEEKPKRLETAHNVIIEGRSSLNISGVEDVESFDEKSIVMDTAKGILLVRGEDLHMEKLSLDGGDLLVTGKINSLEYEDDNRETGGFWARLFR